MFEAGNKVRCIDSECEYYTGKGVRPIKGNIYTISVVKGIYVGLNNDEGTAWLSSHFELVKEERMFEIGGKIRCVNATCSDERLTFGKIYTLLGYSPEGGFSTFEVECDKGYKSWWKEGRFVETFEVGNRIKCVDQRLFSFPKVGEFYEIIRIDRVGDVALKNRLGFCTTCTYPQGMFVKVEEVKMFQVGDRTKSKDDPSCHKAIVTGLTGDSNCPYIIKCSCSYEGRDSLVNYVKEEATMSKYQEIKERIENVKGWDKEADDILRELTREERYMFCIFNCPDHSGRICIYPKGIIKFDPWLESDSLFRTSFSENQREKLEVFKKALLYLLDHSDIKDEKEEKIKELEMHRDTFATHIRSLNLQIEELRR